MSNETTDHQLTKQQYGKLARHIFLSAYKQKWGEYKSIKGYLYQFENGNKALTLYSSLNNDRWWYGISESYWSNWDQNTHLVLLMRDNKKIDFVLMGPEQSNRLLDVIEPVKDNQKKINVRIPSTGKIYIQEWESFPFQEKIKSLGNIETENFNLSSDDIPFEKSQNDPITKLKSALSKLTKEEKNAFIEKLKNEL